MVVQGEQQRNDRYPSWRHITPVETPANDERHAQIAERVRAIAPLGASALDLLDLFTFLAEGASDAEALARLAAKQTTSNPEISDEEVYHALIARTAYQVQPRIVFRLHLVQSYS